jgi:hypothetical protein
MLRKLRISKRVAARPLQAPARRQSRSRGNEVEVLALPVRKLMVPPKVTASRPR